MIKSSGLGQHKNKLELNAEIIARTKDIQDVLS